MILLSIMVPLDPFVYRKDGYRVIVCIQSIDFTSSCFIVTWFTVNFIFLLFDYIYLNIVIPFYNYYATHSKFRPGNQSWNMHGFIQNAEQSVHALK